MEKYLKIKVTKDDFNEIRTRYIKGKPVRDYEKEIIDTFPGVCTECNGMSMWNWRTATECHACEGKG